MIWEDMKSWYCENNYNLRKQLYPLGVSQRAPSKIFGKVVSMPPVLNIQRFWIAHGSECARVLDIPGFWKCLWFWICLDSEYTELWICQVTQGSECAWIMTEYAGICLIMSGYIWICVNLLEYAWINLNLLEWFLF